MIDDCLMDVDNKKLVGSVLLDFSAAFDVIDHNLLLDKLSCYGFLSSAVTWMKSYLSNRSQRVFFNGSLSDIKHVHSGIPQGSCLGPLLFTIFTNDLPLVLDRANVSMYADDTTLYMSATNVDDLSVALNKELQLISDWVVNNRMVLNISKTKSIVFGSHYRLKSNPKLNLSLRGLGIEQVDETKLLGITLDSHLSWSTHIENITKKMGRGLSMIRRCAELLTPTSAVQVIQALVLSHLDYCPAVWSSAAKKDLGKLQIAQNKAARLALRCKSRSNILNMHQNLSWLMVEHRLAASLTLFFRNICLKKKPNCLHKLIYYTSNRHSYTTRHVVMGRFTVPRPRSNAMRRTVMYRAMSFWNSLPLEITEIKGKMHFKKNTKNASYKP